MLSFGSYPDVTLTQARTKRDDARKTLAEGIDPAQKRKEEKTAASISTANTFEVLGQGISRQACEGGVRPFDDKEEYVDAEHFQVGFYRGHMYGPMRHPNGDIACLSDYTEGKMKFPARQRWLDAAAPNVVRFTRPTQQKAPL